MASDSASVISTSNVEFVEEVSERYKCALCQQILQHPLQSSCGHRFCKLCLEILLNAESSPVCPQDGLPCKREETFPDRCAQKEILALNCACSKKLLGCRWTGKLASLGAHMERECAFTKVDCLFASHGCAAVLQRYQLAKHIEKECPYKIISCMYCDGEISEIKLEEHLEKCPKCLISCPHACGDKGIPRDALGDHVTMQCPRAPVHCSLSTVGCQFHGPKESLQKHMDTSLSDHLLMSIDMVEELKQRIQELQDNLKSTGEKSNVLEEKMVAQQEEMEAVKDKLTVQHVTLSAVEELLTSQKESLKSFQQKFDEILDQDDINETKTTITEIKNQVALQEERLSSVEIDILRKTADLPPDAERLQNRQRRDAGPGDGDRRLEQLEKSMALQDIQMADLNLKLQMLESASFDGSFLWKVDDYSRRLNEAVTGKNPSIYSPPFFTGRHGYKVCARLYPNGDGQGRGRYISVFFVIMKGEYDAMLPWPFQQTVTIKLFDQERIQDVTETFTPDPHSASFQRPSAEMNIASGCPKFCSHTMLQSRSFIKENALFIKIITERTDVF